MAYIKTDWVDNQTAITAARMNNIEDGIANNETAITQVETRIGTLSGIGQPIIATSADAMTDTDKIYLYVGDETGYETGHWYYYDTEWVDGGEYGAGATGISNNARNLLKYILERVAYTETGMQVYVNALYEALAQSGGGGGTTTYTITNALDHVTNSNDATGCDEGDSYTATLTADTDYSITTVTVTMGGNDITSTAYNSSTGVITIASVTGDIVITASASISYITVSWNYSSGRLPSTDDGITTTISSGSAITPTFDSANGMYITGGSTSSQYARFEPTNHPTMKKGSFECVFTITAISNDGMVSSRLSNGTNGLSSNFGQRLGNKKVYYLTSTSVPVDTGTTFVLNTEYKFKIEYEENGTNRIYVDDVMIYETNTMSTYYTTANRFYVQGQISAYVKSMKWVVEEE